MTRRMTENSSAEMARERYGPLPSLRTSRRDGCIAGRRAILALIPTFFHQARGATRRRPGNFALSDRRS
jgi:hypothetical protein